MVHARVPVICFAALLIPAIGFAQSYNPVGPQTNVPISTVVDGGWVECYRALYADATGDHLDEIQANCTGERIMLACGEVDSDTLTLLAQATAAEVFTNPGVGPTDSHVANGSQWYFDASGSTENGESSWGFAAQGDTLMRANCDIEGGAAPQHRLCWHIQPGTGGYRCGATFALLNSTAWVKYVYTTSAVVPTTGGSWQIVVIAMLLSCAAAAALHRRTRAATRS